jgi:hypothetical protein
MRRICAAIGLTMLGIAPANASAGLSCEAADKTIKLALEAGVSRGLGDDFFSFKAELEILTPGAPKDFRKVAFGKDSLTQRWHDSRNLKLRIYREREGELHGYVDLVIEAWPRKESDDIEFRGGYTLTIFDMGAKYAGTKKDPEGKTTTLKGRVTCSVG